MEELSRNIPSSKDKKKLLIDLFNPVRDTTRESYVVETFYEVLQVILKENHLDIKKIKFLEVGSGNAVFLDYLKKQGLNVIGVDRIPSGNKESPQIEAWMEKLPFAEESFDVVLSTSVFDNKFYHQNQDHDIMMEEIARVLKHEGLYIGFSEDIEAKSIEGFELIKSNAFSGMSIYKKS